MKTLVSVTEESVRAAAEQILAVIKRKPDAVIALGALCGEETVLRELSRRAEAEAVSLDTVRFFAVCAFDGLSPDDPAGVGARLAEALMRPSGAGKSDLLLPEADDPAEYDEKLRAAGGIDLALLGLGDNARVGFNEPATPYDSHTHLQKLTDRTKKELAPFFGGEEKVPPRGVTMGFRELCAAREIVVIAHGEQKSKALYHMLYARDDSVYPAAFLQLPANVTVYADTGAAKLLGEKHFDAVVFNGD